MKTIYLVTGAAGHLGNTIVRQLREKGCHVRALVLPQDKLHAERLHGAEIFTGDVRNKDSMRAFFATDGASTIVLHCAGIVSIASKYNQMVHDVNVNGTQNVVSLCESYGVKKLVHVSSVHAIPERPQGEIITEVSHFNTENVTGLYAKTKAEATQLVLDAAACGLDASVVHPSGICGPYDYGRGHLTQLLTDYCLGRLTACVAGGYDFVDVRDVAAGVIACAENGQKGETYILSGQYFEVPDLLELFSDLTGKKPIKTVLPLWFAKCTSPFAETYYKLLKQPPLFTAYSLYTLQTNARFSHEKATRALAYTTRPFSDTVADTIDWLKEQNRI